MPSEETRSQFPRSIFFIVGNEFCERFNFYGLRAVLVLYFTNVLLMGPDRATAFYHGFIMLCYFTTLLGAIISDGFIGKFRTIFYLSIVYSCGNIILSLTSMRPLGAPEVAGPMVGLLLIAVGTGGIKPCVSAFGGDQFHPDQHKAIERYFSLFYFAINAGSLLSMFITPILRGDVQCFDDDCFPLAFGVPALLMILAVVIFLLGKPYYQIESACRNPIGLFCRCIAHALRRRFRSEGLPAKSHWLEHADDRFTAEEIADVRDVLRVLLLFVPLPIFWALFDQQSSRWTLQAIQMSGGLGPLGSLKPDQVSVLNPVFILIMVPIFDLLYGAIAKCGINFKPLQRMVCGMCLGALAFVAAAILQLHLQSTTVSVGAGESRVTVLNGADCTLNVSSSIIGPAQSASLFFPAGNQTLWCGSRPISLPLASRQSASLVLLPDYSWKLVPDVLSPPKDGMFSLSLWLRVNHSATLPPSKLTFEPQDNFTATALLSPGHYNLTTTTSSCAVSGGAGGVLRVLMLENGGCVVATVRPPNEVHVLLQTPQYLLLTAGEVLFSVTGLSFAYSQAPASMKAVLQAAWQMTVAFGNLIVIIVAETKVIEDQAAEFFLFAALMAADIAVFGVMALRYKYRARVVDDECSSSEMPSNASQVALLTAPAKSYS